MAKKKKKKRKSKRLQKAESKRLEKAQETSEDSQEEVKPEERPKEQETVKQDAPEKQPVSEAAETQEAAPEETSEKTDSTQEKEKVGEQPVTEAEQSEEDKKEETKGEEAEGGESEEVAASEEAAAAEKGDTSQTSESESAPESSPKEDKKGEDSPSLEELLRRQFGDAILEYSQPLGQETFLVKAESLYGILQYLKEKQDFDYLTDITALDCLLQPDAPSRFCMVYHVYSISRNRRVRLKAFLEGEPPEVDSVVELWQKANWLEREVYDMFGIHFRNHPDLRRILMPDDFPAHPLQKDYPLQGRGERDNFPRVS